MPNNQNVFQQFDTLNMNKLNMTRFIHGQVPYASYHAKLFLCQFDDRLRVVVASANLTLYSWQDISQVMWIQDFPKTSTHSQKTNEFKEYLANYMKQMVPKAVQSKSTIYRKPIDLNNYDFSQASASLVASVNGRFHGKD